MANIPETIVLSLQTDDTRRRHIRKHFSEIGLTNFRFADAIPADSPLVASWYATGKVNIYPPCFRCGKSQCSCPNNILNPSQVANFLSFARIWAVLPKEPQRLFLICEDDVLFFPGAIDRLSDFLSGFVPTGKPLLLRLSESGLPTEQTVKSRLRSSHDKIMSNPAYIVNGAMADLLSQRFDEIDTTSDIWLHRHIASDPWVEALSLEPRLTTDLSYNAAHARFPSNIHPKGIDEADRQRQVRHIKRVDTPSQYDQLRQQWARAIT
jgi:GR25 family glycosyltransferase involved in LPS biosynthesis